MKKLNRKDFIKQSAAGMFALGTGGLFLQCSNDDLHSIKPIQKDQVNASVSTVLGDNLIEMTRNAINALGGMSTIVDKDDVVFVNLHNSSDEDFSHVC